MTTMTLGIRLWLAGLRSALQYRTDTFIVIVMALVFQGTGFAFAWVVLTRFQSIAGWTLGEIAFLYGLRLVVHAVAGVLGGPSLASIGRFARASSIGISFDLCRPCSSS